MALARARARVAFGQAVSVTARIRFGVADALSWAVALGWCSCCLSSMLAALHTSVAHVGPFTADIHFPLSGDAASVAMRANEFLSSRMHNEIDFRAKYTPHVTLYLTEWQCTEKPDEVCKDPLLDALSSTLYGISANICTVSLSKPYAAGQFAMLNVSLLPCLQRASDTVVKGTYQLAVPNQTVPSWVYSLPEPTRSEKIALVRKYGSPNVLGQFQPHVTIGWAQNASAVAAAVAALSVKPASFQSNVVALGSTGPHGTVLKGRDLAVFNLTVRGDACHKAHKAEAECDADKLTTGGCVWCDIVDRPAFCSTRTNARELPRFPPHNCNW
mgnify:CR=1 FL=1